MIKQISVFLTGLTLSLTIFGMISSTLWTVSQIADTRPPFGEYYLTIEDPNVDVDSTYWATWNIERLRNDCKISFVTMLFDSAGREYILASSELSAPTFGEVHPGEVRSYSREYELPEGVSSGTAKMTARIRWVCNDTRHALGLIDVGNYNTIEIFIK